MRYVIGQRPTTPRGAARGAVSGCGCGGAAASNPRNSSFGFGWKPGISRNPAPQFRAGVRYGGGTSTAAPTCYMGVNGQVVCPGATNLRARGGTRAGSGHDISPNSFALPGSFCVQRTDGWHCCDKPPCP